MAQVLRLPLSRSAARKKDEHWIKDGKVKLYIRADINTDHWTYKFKRFLRDGEKVSGSRYVIISTDTPNLDDAKRIAATAYERAYNAHAQGLSAHVPTFAKHTAAFLANEFRKVESGKCTQNAYDTAKHRLEKFIIPLLGDVALDQFHNDIIAQFHKARMDAWKIDPRRHANGGTMNIKQPSSGSDSKLEGLIVRVLKHAIGARKISANPLAGLEKSPRSSGRHGAFSLKNWPKLSAHLTKWVCDCPRADWCHTRQSLRAFVHTCRLAGLRVAECYPIQIGDIDLYPDVEEWAMKGDTLVAEKKDVVTLCVFGPEDPKTGERLGNKIKDKGSHIGHKRTINVTADLRPYLLAVLASHPHRGNPKAPLWVKADGEPVVEYHHAFEEVLEELGMTRDEEGNNLVLGSLRHSFITEKLWEMGKPGSKATLPMIEAYCDTSQKEIKLHYNHVLQQIASTGIACSI
jgi:hypothetical protein